jgi:hypothetical protein
MLSDGFKYSALYLNLFIISLLKNNNMSQQNVTQPKKQRRWSKKQLILMSDMAIEESRKAIERKLKIEDKDKLMETWNDLGGRNAKTSSQDCYLANGLHCFEVQKDADNENAPSTSPTVNTTNANIPSTSSAVNTTDKSKTVLKRLIQELKEEIKEDEEGLIRKRKKISLLQEAYGL